MGTLRYIEREIRTADYGWKRLYVLSITTSDDRFHRLGASATTLKSDPHLQPQMDRLVWQQLLWAARHPVRWFFVRLRVTVRLFYYRMRFYLEGAE